MTRTEAYRKLLNIVGRKVQSLSVLSSSSSTLSPAFRHSHLIRRKPLQCPWNWSSSGKQQTFRFCTKTDLIEIKLEASNRVKSVCVREAHQLHQAGHRSSEEFRGGHIIGAINIPYMHKNGSEMKRNPNFLEEVSSHFVRCDKIIVGCRSGKRSLMAADDLISVGYTSIIDVAGGFEAWTQHGLPTQN